MGHTSQRARGSNGATDGQVQGARYRDSMAPQSVERLKSLLREVAPALKGVRVQSLRTLKDGVVLQTLSKAEVEAVEKCTKLEALGFSTDRVMGRKLRCLVYDVPREMTDEDLLTELYAKNCDMENGA
nr:PREDICTED: uncharacterized protein LOC107398219 [Tribolium castaneum]|eukprot:XP_015837076.1 PREDICTED: uncharacterized protein LOC107398219 [Tribolium castaneum]